jgi:hypothetical protein
MLKEIHGRSVGHLCIRCKSPSRRGRLPGSREMGRILLTSCPRRAATNRSHGSHEALRRQGRSGHGR